MSKMMLIDATGLLPSFYAEDVHGPAQLEDGSANPAYPAGCVELTDDTWMDFLTHQGQRIWNPKTSAFDPYAPPPPPAAVPDLISDRQCFQQLAVLGKVSPDEALAAVTVGALPKAVTDGIATLPPDQQFAAKMLLCGDTQFHRLHAMVPTFLGFVGLNGTTDRDALWTAAAAL